MPVSLLPSFPVGQAPESCFLELGALGKALQVKRGLNEVSKCLNEGSAVTQVDTYSPPGSIPSLYQKTHWHTFILITMEILLLLSILVFKPNSLYNNDIRRKGPWEWGGVGHDRSKASESEICSLLHTIEQNGNGLGCRPGNGSDLMTHHLAP